MDKRLKKHLDSGGWIGEVTELDPKVLKKLKTMKKQMPQPLRKGHES